MHDNKQVAEVVGKFVARGETRVCCCGCGQPAARHFNHKGENKGWRSYARGHAPNHAIEVRVPENPVDLAYAAGIIDGEGCIYARVYTRKNSLSTIISLRVTMCSEVCITWLYDMFGGEVFIVRPPSAKLMERFTWQVRGRRAQPVIEALLPYLKEKLIRAELALELIALLKENSYQKISDEERSKREVLAGKIKWFNRNPRGEDFVLTA